MFNLTQKAAKHFKEVYSSLEGRSGNFWRLDTVYINHRKILMCVHEPTLFTHLFYGTEYKTYEPIVRKLKDYHPWFMDGFSVGKGLNRRVGGSMTDMKISMKYYSEKTLKELEEEINQTPYSYLEHGVPESELQEFVLR